MGLSKTYPELGKVTASGHFDDCAAACVGLDGRAIRKTVANALASSPQTAVDPNQVTAEHLLEAAKAAKASRVHKATTK
jgi:hypothetical protein